MIFARKFAEGFADVLRRGRLLDAESAVIIFGLRCHELLFVTATPVPSAIADGYMLNLAFALTSSLLRTVLTAITDAAETCLLLLRDRRGLPGDSLPLSVALHKCSGVAESARHWFLVLCCVHYQPKVHDREIAILMNLKILSLVRRIRSRRRGVPSIREDVCLRDHLTGSSRVDNVIRKKMIERGTLIIGNVAQELLNHFNQFLLLMPRLLRSAGCEKRMQRDIRSLLRRINRESTRNHSQNKNDPAQRDRLSCNALGCAH